MTEMLYGTDCCDGFKDQLPIVPKDVLKQYFVENVNDTRFSSCARLLQSIWRDRRQLELGRYKPLRGKSRRLGSRLAPPVARTGVSFLTPDIAKVARIEAAYREIGALIDERRLWENLLSSQALTFNLFGRAKLDRDYACRLCQQLLPGFLAEVSWVAFEHSPGRGDPRLLGDYTAFDVFVMGAGADGAPAFIAIEVKYSESLRQPPRSQTERYRELTREYALHLDPEAPGLLAEPFAQLTAEHLLAAVIRAQLGKGARGAFAVIAPAANRDAWNALELYRQALVAKQPAVAFETWTLETVIKAICNAGDDTLAQRLHERYTDFTPIHALIEEWEPFAE